MNRLILIAACAALAPAAVLAQDNTAAPAAAPAAAVDAAPAETVPPPNCNRPAIERDPKTGKILHVKELNKTASAYQACIDAYTAAQKQAAQAHYNAADAAVHQFNDFAHDMNAAAAEVEAKNKATQDQQQQQQQQQNQ